MKVFNMLRQWAKEVTLSLYFISAILQLSHARSFSTLQRDNEAQVDTTEGLSMRISGTVINRYEEALSGVNIAVKESAKRTTSDLKGYFVLEQVDESAILVVSHTGYRTEEIRLNGVRDTIIVLQEDEQQLDEVVVVGYGTQKKINLTGSVSTLGSSDIENKPFTKVSNALSGQMAGVYVVTPGGLPGHKVVL